MTPRPDVLQDAAEQALATALRCGAKEAAAKVTKLRDVSVRWRDGAIEKVEEATTRRLSLHLYVDGRFSAVSSSDLRPEALATFISDSVAMTRALAPDPFRVLPDPALYAGRAEVDLQLDDPAYPSLTPEERRRQAREMEEGARSVPDAAAIVSVTTHFNDARTESVAVTSNGFSGRHVETSFWVYGGVTVMDVDGRRPEEHEAAGSRFLAELPAPDGLGRAAARRALSRRGAQKVESAVLPLAIENRAVPRLLGALLGPLSGQALQQKRSFLEGRLGTAVGSALLDLRDEPLIPRGFGSRLYDGEGLAARPRALFEDGVLRTYLIDTYYGRKLGLAPTTGGTSNVVLRSGAQDARALLREMGEGVYVTGFLGGNANGTTGDFSMGVRGFRVRGGEIAEPVAEVNLSGHLGRLAERLVAVGNDPYPYSSWLTPTVVFDGAQFAGL